MMGDNLGKVFIFVAGAAAGAFATWIVMDKKCKMLQEDIDVARELYLDNRDGVVAEVREADPKPDIKEYSSMINNLGYSKENEKYEIRPYIIEPGEFGMLDGYKEVTLTYWADGVLSDDETDKPIDEIDDVIGVEALDVIGEFEDGVIHVRNDELNSDYEVSLDVRKYKDVIGNEQED